MDNCKECLTLLSTGHKLTKHEREAVLDATLYRSVVGALQYATLTRLELTFAVNKFSQFMASPRCHNW